MVDKRRSGANILAATSPRQWEAGVQFIEAHEFGNDVPERYVTGIASIEMISKSTLRIAYYSAHRMPGGAVENRIILNVIWDAREWLDSAGRCMEGREAVRQAVEGDSPMRQMISEVRNAVAH